MLADFQITAAIVYGLNGSSAQWRIRDSDGQLREPVVQAVCASTTCRPSPTRPSPVAGLAWLPCWLISPRLRSGEVTLVTSSQDTVASEVHAVWPQSRYLPSKTRTAIDVLVEKVPGVLGP